MWPLNARAAPVCLSSRENFTCGSPERKDRQAPNANLAIRQGLFIGSGVVEAGCKSVVGQRLKQSGMFWSLPGAENILAIRCVLENHQFNQFWQDRFPVPQSLPMAA